MYQLLLIIMASVSMSTVKASQIELVIELDGLQPMQGQHYEGWNIINESPQSTGRFALNKNGNIYQVNAKGAKLMKVGSDGVAKFDVNRNHLQSKLFVLTVEPDGDTDSGPSKVHLMGGHYEKGAADLSVAHGSSLKTDFLSAKGSFILAAPTGGNFNQGVWFLDPVAGASSLSLPELPEGWAYEGWIVNSKNGGKFSTGLFKETSGADADGAGPMAGPLKLNFPKAPGQDIVQSSVVLNDGIHVIVVSVEPYPDYDPAPFALKVLKSLILATSPGMSSLTLDNIANTVPSGKVHLH